VESSLVIGESAEGVQVKQERVRAELAQAHQLVADWLTVNEQLSF